jgi:hypothetical protein
VKLTFLTLLISCASLIAQEGAAFVAPQPYPVSRYEAGWNKNPFTLKTAPVVAASASFAADLAIGSYYGDAENPTVDVVNTKTGERTRLKKDKPAPNGMKLVEVTIGTGRKEVSVNVTLGKEVATLQFNESYLKQVAGSAAAAKAAQGKTPAQTQARQLPNGAPGGVPLPGMLASPPATPGIAQTPGQAQRAVPNQALRLPLPGVVATQAPALPGSQQAPAGSPSVPNRIRVVGAAAPTGIPQ